MMQSPQLLPILYCLTFEALSPSLDESFFSTLGYYKRKILFPPFCHYTEQKNFVCMILLDDVINTYLVVVPEADDEAIPKLGSAPKFPALPPLLLYIV